LLQITDQDVLQNFLSDNSREKVLREIALGKIEDPEMLTRIARNEPDLKLLEATLTNIKNTDALLDIAKSAQYKLTRKLIIARADSYWRKDLGLVSVHFNVGQFQTEVRVTVKNNSRDLAYDRLRYTFDFMAGVDPEMAPQFSGTIEPGENEMLSSWLSGDWGSTINDQTVIFLIDATPILPDGAVDLTELGEVPEKASTNQPPVISETAIWKHTTIADGIFGDLRGVTTEIFITATDPDGDVLTYEWQVSNGTLSADRPVASWNRIIENGAVKDGTITVSVDDGNGGHASRTFSSEGQ
jgi:hypothetical protein